MFKGMFAIIKAALMIAIATLAIIGSMYVLGVFEDAAIKETLVKVMSVIGIFAVASLTMMLVACLGNQKTPAE